MDVTIVGARPTGCYAAWKMSKEHSVTLLEDHAVIGEPVQCTGILTDDILHYLKRKDLLSVTNMKVHKCVVHAPTQSVQIPITTNYIVDKAAYVRMIAQKAADAGASVRVNTRYIGGKIKDTGTGKESLLTGDLLIGADGPNSTVAKQHGFVGKREFLTGVQAVVNVDSYDERIHFYPSIGEYAWYCPEGNGRARIGIAARTQARKIFDQFITRYPGKIECMQGGPIPLYRPRRTVQQGSVMLIGDAAMQVKNTTGGGIIAGIKACEALVKEPLRYQKNLGGLNRELATHYLVNKAMRNFTDNDWDQLIRQAQDPKVQKILRTTNRDHALGMIGQLIRGKPSLLKWARKLI